MRDIMKLRAILSLMIVAMAGLLIHSATMALFVDQAQTNNNDFETGVVTVNIDSEQLLETSLDLTNLVPGDQVTGSFIIRNEGTVDLWYELVPNKEGDFWTGVDLMVDAKHGYLTPEEERVVTYVVSIGAEASQQAEGSLTFTVDGVQGRNHIPEWVIYVDTGEDLQAAIDAADVGSVLLVGPGDFGNEITVDKPLTLFGNNWLNAELAETTVGYFITTAENVVYRGFPELR